MKTSASIEKGTGKGGTRRQFDRGQVLETAMKLFWRYGYEATSIATLLEATGLTAPSLYGTFGNKEQLFMEAVEHYAATYSVLLYRSLDEPIPARDAIRRMLYEAAEIFSMPGHPAGCFIVSGAANCSSGSAYIEEELRKRRQEKEAAICERLKQAKKKGELPKSAQPEKLARFFNTVMQGLSTQSQDGATRKQLEDIADNAMLVWP